MERILGIELYGPLNEESSVKPVLGDTVGTLMEDGRLRLLTITGAHPTPEGMVLYATGGEKLLLDDCYLLYTVDNNADQSNS